MISELHTNASLNLDAFLGSEVFPRTVEEGYKALQAAASKLEQELQQVIDISQEHRTFENTVMAYHDAMIRFDAFERLVRSERLIADEAAGKMELLDHSMSVRDASFSNQDLMRALLVYAKGQLDSGLLLPWQWECVRGVIGSMKEEYLSSDLQEVKRRLLQAMDASSDEEMTWQGVLKEIARQERISYTYLRGNCDSKVIDGVQKAFSFLSLNLCFMPETNSMIYGGLLPWRERLDAITDKITAFAPDIIFLQEIYDIQAIFELHKRLNTSYTHFYGNMPPKTAGFSPDSLYSSSGLAVISKYRLDDVTFEPFSVVTDENSTSTLDRLKVFGFDRAYGLLHAVVKNGQEPIAHVTTTHLNPFFASVRAAQMEQTVAMIKRENLQHPELPSILCGDLNIERGDLNEGGELLINEHFTDHYNGPTTCVDYGDYWHKWMRDVEKFVEGKPTPWTVDRSLLLSVWANQNEHTLKIEHIPMNDLKKPEEALSDHHGIHTQFTYIKI